MKKLSILEINKQTVKIVNSIKILDKISWPAEVEKTFFRALARGRKASLKFDYPKYRFNDQYLQLSGFLKILSKEDPVQQYVRNTILSYMNAINMIHHIGRPEFQEFSIQEYGVPSHMLFGSRYSHLESAKMILKSYHNFEHPSIDSGDQAIYSAEQIRRYVKKESDGIFKNRSPKFVLSKELISKAAAGRTRVRFRSNAKFSRYEYRSLLIHEVMTHTLTAINGNLQKNLPLLGQGSPRTTKTQEGLATFAEVMSGSLDLVRLKRISVRVLALDMALKGADFYQLYDFFIHHGQDPRESFLSASRLLRGGRAEGGIVFTKDGVYLEGLIRVYGFFRWAFRTQNLDLAHLLFCGRIDINDIFLLRGSYHQGIVQPPRYLPQWYQEIDLLAGKMAFSLFLTDIDLKTVDSHYSKKIHQSIKSSQTTLLQ